MVAELTKDPPGERIETVSNSIKMRKVRSNSNGRAGSQQQRKKLISNGAKDSMVSADRSNPRKSVTKARKPAVIPPSHVDVSLWHGDNDGDDECSVTSVMTDFSSSERTQSPRAVVQKKVVSSSFGSSAPRIPFQEATTRKKRDVLAAARQSSSKSLNAAVAVKREAMQKNRDEIELNHTASKSSRRIVSSSIKILRIEQEHGGLTGARQNSSKSLNAIVTKEEDRERIKRSEDRFNSPSRLRESSIRILEIRGENDDNDLGKNTMTKHSEKNKSSTCVAIKKPNQQSQRSKSTASISLKRPQEQSERSKSTASVGIKRPESKRRSKSSAFVGTSKPLLREETRMLGEPDRRGKLVANLSATTHQVLLSTVPSARMSSWEAGDPSLLAKPVFYARFTRHIVLIQALGRGYLERQSYKRNAAIKIQSYIRMLQAQASTGNLRVRSRAAVKLQAGVRFMLVWKRTRVPLLQWKLVLIEERKQDELRAIREQTDKKINKLRRNQKKCEKQRAEATTNVQEKVHLGKDLIQLLKKENAKLREENKILRQETRDLAMLNHQAIHQLERVEAKIKELEKELPRLEEEHEKIVDIENQFRLRHKQYTKSYEDGAELLNLEKIIKDRYWEAIVQVIGHVEQSSYDEAHLLARQLQVRTVQNTQRDPLEKADSSSV